MLVNNFVFLNRCNDKTLRRFFLILFMELTIYSINSLYLLLKSIFDQKMKNRLYFLIFVMHFFVPISAQKFVWNANLNYFFDNTEYAKSTIAKDQTMTGVHIAPEFGLAFDSIHSLYAGVDLLKTAGSQNVIDNIQPIAYYKFQNRKISFYAGAFSRSELLSNYSDLFFQDSVNYYRPTLTGIFWQVGRKESFFNLWLDWNGHQTSSVRETFFVGASAHKKIGMLFTDFQSYMFHFANTRPMNLSYSVCDNLLAHLSVGVDYSNNTGLDTLLFAAGILAGGERDRALLNGSYFPIGVVFRLNAEYKGFGTQNMLYTGNARDVFYNKYNNEFYWNNPFLRSGFYLQSKWYLDVIRSQSVNGKLSMNLQFSQGKMMFEQVFTLKAKLNSSSKLNTKSKPTFMTNWFK